MLCLSSVSLVLKERETTAFPNLGSVHLACLPGRLPGAHQAAAPENLLLTASPSGPPIASPTLWLPSLPRPHKYTASAGCLLASLSSKLYSFSSVLITNLASLLNF